MNKKITKLLSVFVIAGVIGTGAAVGLAGCSNKTPEHEHTAATEWQSDANGHWHNCTADDGAKLDEGAHVYDDDQDTTCNTCGYERTVTPAPTPAEPTVTSVTVTAAGNATTVENDGTLQLSAAVAGENNPAQTVTWSIKEGATATGATVSESGLLSAGTVAGSVTVVATSTVDTSKKGEITITVEAAELDLEVEIAGPTTVAEGGSITLTATVEGVPAGGETGVIWSVDDEDVATITQEGVLTGVAPGSVTVTAKAKADESFYATFDVVVTAASTYDKLANRADNIIAENFNSNYTEGQQLTTFSDWGTAGVYTKVDSAGKGVIVSGNQAANATGLASNVSLVADFGAVEGVVEGYFKFQFLAASSSGNGNNINFYNGSTKVLTIMGRPVGTPYVVTIAGVETAPTVSVNCDLTTMVTVQFKFDLANKKVTLKLNDTTVCEDLECSIDCVNGFDVATSNSGARGIYVDDIVVCGAELTVGTYKTRTNAKVTALETTYSLGGMMYNMNIKGAYESAISAATTFAEVDTAYDELYASVLDMFVQQAEMYVADLWTDYTHDAEKITALKNTIYDEIEAMTDIADVYAVLSMDFADRLEKEDIHDDSYYAQVDVTVVIYEKGTTTSVVKSTADLTDKAGEAITLAELNAAIEVPSGKAILALYSDADCTTVIIGDLTLDAAGATTATTMIIYVEFGDMVVYSADNCGLAAGDKLAATENAAFSIANSGNSHALTALAEAGGGTTATANDDSGLVFSSAFLPGGGTKSLTVTAKEDMKLIVYYTISDGGFNTKVQSKSGYLVWTIGEETGADTNQNSKDGRTAYACEITLKAGDVCVLNSSSNRLALFALVAIC